MNDINKEKVEKAVAQFHSLDYLRHNARRLEHLSSLGIPVSGMSVLEVGAGIGDHSDYYLDRGCDLTITEARPENLYCLKSRFPGLNVQHLDIDDPGTPEDMMFDLIHCYGLLYHLSKPGEAIEYLGKRCNKMMFLETCVSFGDENSPNLTEEPVNDPTQSFVGMGCRPTRRYIYERLKQQFKYVYIPQTQPNHEQFPIDWDNPINQKEGAPENLFRAVFIASKAPLENDLLTEELINRQVRHP